MADQIQEIMDIPREFVKDGSQFLNRCTKQIHGLIDQKNLWEHKKTYKLTNFFAADLKEFIRISRAVGLGFLIMGAVGYLVKLIHIPVNNILVGGA